MQCSVPYSSTRRALPTSSGCCANQTPLVSTRPPSTTPGLADERHRRHEAAMLVTPRAAARLTSSLLVILLVAAGVETSPKPACSRATREDLERLLGSAFNARYMAIDKPDPEPTSSRLTARHSEDPLSDQADLEAGGFSVDADFRQDLPGERRRVREKRSETAKPWGCTSRLEWEDLGDDRFPRYLRNVKCLGGDCWFGKFRCKARAFTVKVLRRKSGKEKDGDCVVSASTADLPAELREHWEFEERAVAFCCDCSVDD